MTIPGLILVNGTNKSAILTSSITESFFASGGVGFFGGSELFETSGGGADFVREFSKSLDDFNASSLAGKVFEKWDMDKDGVRKEVGYGIERTLFSPGPNRHSYKHLCCSAGQAKA